MGADLLTFFTAHGTMVILAVAVLAAIGIVQWRKAREAELELALKTELLEHGVEIADVDRLLAAKGPARRGWLEQFASLSGGAKAGLIIVFVLVANMVMCSVIALNQPRNFFPSPLPPQPSPPVGLVAQAPKYGEGGQVFYIDLQPAAKQRLNGSKDEEDGNPFAGLPRGHQELGGVPFQVGPAFLRLRGQNRPELPAETKGLRIGLALDKLHFLHAAQFGGRSPFFEKDGVEIGRYRVHYADGIVRDIPIIYGEDVRDFWDWDKLGDVKRGQVAWRGSNPYAGYFGAALRLYRTTWENPKPDTEVTSIDFISPGETVASPFCVAMTAERKW